ncbi:MAG: hypothetical protein E6I45_02895 [Chloroflexi bacterium]|nr:MAG: hypothetical protein E6I45_02895 [Chloroflexota bacterium]
MAGVIYLDIDDEITSAAARIRAADEARVALVLPAGSRVATSRINFRLLAREAQARNRALSIVAPEGSARSLAASAGLPAFATVAEFEEAHGKPASTPAAELEGDLDGEPDGFASAIAQPDNVGQTAILTPVPAGPQTAARERPRAFATGPDVRSRPVVEPGRRRVSGRLIALVAILALTGIVVAVGAYLLLPSASIVITPRTESLGPLDLTVRADPAAQQADPAAGVVPAQQASIPLTATGEFSSTDKKVRETKATGRVRFTSRNTASKVTIPAGTQVSTSSGVVFVTTQAVTVPRAVFIPPTPGIADAPIQAVAKGTSGNVDAGTITHVSTSVQAQLVNSEDPVNNEQPTTGGTHTEKKVVGQKDVDGAVATLKKSLTTQLDAAVDDPQRLPAGTTAFPDTKAMTEPVPSSDPATLVGKEIEKFTLGMTATGTVTGVDQTQVQQLAEQRIRGGVDGQHDLVAGSVSVKVGAGSVQGSTVTFPVTATARQVKRLDLDKLRDEVKGRRLDEARTILEPYGDVAIDVWPSYVSVIPSFDFRLDLRVANEVATEQPGPGRSTSSPSAPASRSPTGSRSPAGSRAPSPSP